MSEEQDKDISQPTRAQTAHTLLQVFLDAQKLSATRIYITPPNGEEDLSEIEFFAPEASGKNLAIAKTTKLDFGDARILKDCFDHRSYYWPDIEDEIFASNSKKSPRVLFAPLSKFRVMGEFITSGKPGTPRFKLTIDSIVRDKIKPLVDILQLSAANREFLLSAIRCRNGIILADASERLHEIDACAVIQALRPDAVLFDTDSTDEEIEQAIALADSSLVIVAVRGIDPVERLFSFLGRFADNSEHYDSAVNKVILSYTHRRIKRVCSECVRSTPVLKETIEKLPEVLRPLAEETYQFGRGCKNCGNSAYRGSVGLDSAVLINDVLRILLRQKSNPESIAKAAYKHGARSLLEDGLGKIYSGFCSFEGVFSITNQISPAFALAAKENMQAETGPSTPGTQENDAAEADSTKTRTLLIVEDDNDQRDVLEMVFATEGFEVLSAEHGQDALTKLHSHEVDIIVCDVMMPVMGGVDFVKALRKNDEYANLPVLMLTAVSDPDDECALLSFGADDYCDKNVKRKVLLRRVKRLLERRATTAPDAENNPVSHLLKS